MSAARRWMRRVVRVFELDPEVFEEVEHDHFAGPQAFATVLLASLAGGVGNVGAAILLGERQRPFEMMLVEIAGFVVAWVVWSFLMMAVGTLFGGVADMGETLRALGFASAPGLLMIVPGVGLVIGVPWALVAMVVAVRQALDFTTGKALGTVAVGAFVAALILLPAGCLVASGLAR